MSSGTLKKQLTRSAIQMAVLDGVAAMMAVLAGVVLARGLGAHSYGVYVYASALVYWLMLLSQMGVPTLIMRNTVSSRVRSDWATLRSMVIRFSQLFVLASFAMIFASLVALWWFFEQMSTHQFYTFIWLLLFVPVYALRGVGSAVLHGMNRVVVNRVTGAFIPSCVRLIAIGLLFWLMPATRLPEYVAFVNLIVGLGSLGLVGLCLWHYLPEEFFRGETVYHTRQWLLNALPFILYTGTGMLHARIDIFTLGFFQPAEQIGLYDIAVKGTAFATGVLQIRTAVLAPHITRMYLQNETRQLQRMVAISSRIFFAATSVIVLAVVLFGEEMMVWLLGDEFYAAYPSLVILMFGMLGVAATGPVCLLANMTRHEKDSVRTIGIGAVINLVLNFALIPHYGIVGAAVATVTSLILRNIYLHSIVKSKTGIKCSIF